MTRGTAFLAVCLPFLVVSVAPAQTRETLLKEAPTVTVANGVVAGRVIFADTNGPARFAKVYLKSATKSADPGDAFLSSLEAADGRDKAARSKTSPADKAEGEKKRAASISLFSAIADRMVASTIAADGTYAFSNVKSGTYYVHVDAPGYIDPLAQFSSSELSSADPAIRARIAAAATAVTVTGSDPVRADLRLERGADISGRVLYDDGTPAVGWTVRVVHKAAPGDPNLAIFGLDPGDLDLAHMSEASSTDDTGHFRVAGLPTGDYVLQARLTAGVPGRSALNPTSSGASPTAGMMAGLVGLKMSVYSGNTVRQADAKPVGVRAGEDRTDVDLTVPLSRFREVGGTVLARGNGHPVNGGTLDLTALDSNGKEDPSLHWTTAILPDGSFRFVYIPGPGEFSLRVTHAVDATSGPIKQVFGSLITEAKTTHTYGEASQTVSLADADLSNLKVTVPESDPATP